HESWSLAERVTYYSRRLAPRVAVSRQRVTHFANPTRGIGRLPIHQRAGILPSTHRSRNGSAAARRPSMASHRTVLLVEDDPHRLDALGFALRRHGHHVLTATDGHRAAELMARGLPDVVVVEMLLPGQSGFQVAALAKAWSDGRVPVVMLAGIAADAQRDYALAVGADVFLARPVSPEEVFGAIEVLCPHPVHTRRPGSGTTPHPAPTPG